MDEHSHVTVERPQSADTTTGILAAIVGLIAVLTALGAAAVWPEDQSFRGSRDSIPPDARWVVADVTGESDETTFVAEVRDETELGEVTMYVPEATTAEIAVGDAVRAVLFDDGTLVFAEHERATPMWVLLWLYVLLVVAVAWWRGIGALLGLVIAFGIVLFFTVPALFSDGSPLLIGLVTGAGALFVLLYMAHGVNARSTTAYIGTLAGVLVTALLASWAVDSSKLTGLWLETGAHTTLVEKGVSLPGVVLCGIILAGLGILNDVTVTQASAVWELRAARPDISRVDLFWRGMRIGRDHIASTVYTIAFAYVGAALPAILLLSLYDQSLGATLTGADIAEEIVRTLVGSIGLVLAVPLTTAIAAAVVGRDAAVKPAPAPGMRRAADHVDASVPAEGPAPRG